MPAAARSRQASLARPPHAPAAGALLAATLVLLAPAVCLAWSFSIKGHDFALEATDTFVYTYHFDDVDGLHSATPGPGDEDFAQLLKHQFYNTLDASLGYDVFRLGARMDLNLFAGRAFDEHCGGGTAYGWCGQSDRRYVQDFALERIFFIVALPEMDVTLGDFYASIGRGMALNVVKLQELAQDNAIRGGKFELHHGILGLTLLGGQFNILDLDVPSGLRSPWREDSVIAGRLEVQLFDGEVIAGAHGVFIMNECGSAWCEEVQGLSQGGGEILDLGSELVVGAGVDLPDLWDGTLGLGAEVDLQRSDQQDGTLVRAPWNDAPSRGLAVYGTATLQFGDLSILGEGKYYDGFELRARKAADESILGFKLLYHQPPTLERINAFINNNTSVGGFRARGDYNLGQLGPLDVLVWANFAFFENWDNAERDRRTGEHVDVRRRVYAPHGGVEASWMEGQGNLKLGGGLRNEEDLYFDRIFMQDAFVETDLEQAFLERHSVKLTFNWLHRTKDQWAQVQLGADPAREYKSWNEMELYLTYKWSPHGEVFFTYERQEDPSFSRESYFGGGARYYVTPGTYVNLRAGQNRPGIKCLNGACRLFPAFSGVELTLVGRI